MTWLAIGVLAAAAYGLKAFGFFGLSRLATGGALRQYVLLVPVALFAGLVVVPTFGEGSFTEVWTRFVGVSIAGIAVWRRVPLVAVIVIAAGVTALLRLVV